MPAGFDYEKIKSHNQPAGKNAAEAIAKRKSREVQENSLAVSFVDARFEKGL